jgi:hypothetical protein
VQQLERVAAVQAAAGETPLRVSDGGLVVGGDRGERRAAERRVDEFEIRIVPDTTVKAQAG